MRINGWLAGQGRTRIVVFGLAVLLIAGALLVVSGVGRVGDSGRRETAVKGSAPTGVPKVGAAAGSAPAVETQRPTAALRSLPPVPVGQPAAFVAGLSVTVTGVTAMHVTGHGAGEMSGPGAKVNLEVRNQTSSAFDLGSVAVTASYGGRPATRTDDPLTKELAGELAPGQVARGVYLFAAPAQQVGALRIEVSSSSAADVLLFQN